MTIWRGTSAVPVVGPEIHLKYEMIGGVGENKLEKASEALSRAREMIEYINSKASDGFTTLNVEQEKALHYYFLFKALGPDQAKLIVPEIAAVFQSIKTGLYGKGLDIKVTNTNSSSIGGYVTAHHNRILSKEGWTSGKALKSGKSKSVQWGSIHVSSRRLKDDADVNLAAKTIIHEASHKFASTADFGEKGYTYDANLHFRADGLTHQQALNNAESYAAFACYSFTHQNSSLPAPVTLPGPA